MCYRLVTLFERSQSRSVNGHVSLSNSKAHAPDTQLNTSPLTSVSGGKSAFTLNAATEPPRLIVALTQDKPEGGKPMRYWLYGLALGACMQVGRPAKSTSAPGRLTVSVSQIRDRVELGYADIRCSA